jgi:hypothetical protein
VLSTKLMACAFGLSLALGGMKACAAPAAPPSAVAQKASTARDALRDLGDLPPPTDTDSATPASASTVSSAESVPELPTWAMILLCFAGLALAGLKGGRKDRLSPGID